MLARRSAALPFGIGADYYPEMALATAEFSVPGIFRRFHRRKNFVEFFAHGIAPG
jgi:hypothetical protein